jgi:plastocyanin
MKKEHMMKRRLTMILVALLVSGLVPAAHARARGALQRLSAAVSPEQTVLVGLSQREVSQGAALSYTPKYLDVTVGETVIWKDVDVLEPHTVSFGPLALLKDLAGKDQFIRIPQKTGPPHFAFNPKVAFPTPPTPYAGTAFANSGLLTNGKAWSLTFAQPGTYEYICLIHGLAMNGYVIVHPVQPRQGTLYHVQAGDGVRSTADRTNATTSDAFYPQNVTIHVGDAVQWVGGFHTVTFGPPSLLTHLQESFIVPVPQTSGPPLLTLNPQVALPSGGTTFSGKGFVNSGILPLTLPPGSTAPASFTLTFTKAGTYPYVCLVHPGMDGTITVVP